MRKVFILFIISFSLFISCNKSKNIQNTYDVYNISFSSELVLKQVEEYKMAVLHRPDKLPALAFYNIDLAYEFFNIVNYNLFDYKDVYLKLEDSFKKSEFSRLMGYDNDGVIIADINNDGIYELYLNAYIGSGWIHSFIHGYDPKEDQYYILSERFIMDYRLFVYKNDVYIYGNDMNISINEEKREGKIFKPALQNNKFLLEEIETSLYNEMTDADIKDIIFNQFEIM